MYLLKRCYKAAVALPVGPPYISAVNLMCFETGLGTVIISIVTSMLVH